MEKKMEHVMETGVSVLGLLFRLPSASTGSGHSFETFWDRWLDKACLPCSGL